ncbi:MAG: response regulator transcription factor [Saprospiraceae bacterium]|jgi:two-component system LytT family response regulator|nr:response regulator transcription factor [Saprospiraceae bacterium]MBK6479387.1 response regulator transcription factor [Saprospiraceae bacterium]MBK7372963.1 response regulator transcription factor [Saprospiraceae bacterium]MBK7439689.1 response regulator transcription factor [Saprospiraceae bacterium]MBK7606090.1 response regulator transcription factor [Saprospiraceae bacterium]
MIRTILIDDEKDSLSALSHVLTEMCPEVSVVDSCQIPALGIESILKHKPDLVFLDVEMPKINGFELLEEVKHQAPAIIFTTAYSHYAIRAIKYSAIDYLVKPVDPVELIEAIARYKIQKTRASGAEQIQFLLDKLSEKENTLKKLAIPNMEGFKLVDIEEIMYCAADDNYTDIHLKNKTKITASRTLKDIQNLLSDYQFFFRIHHSYLINLREVNQYIRGEGGYVIMNDGAQLNVSRSKKETLIRYLIP